MKNLKTLIKSTRPSFLLLPLVCVFLAYSFAVWQNMSVNTLHLVFVLIGGVSAHISVNCFNEYFDFKSGLDAKTDKTPFSGGSGALIENAAALNAVLTLGVLSLLLCFAIGVYFATAVGTQIILIGALGALIIFTYTSWLNKQPLLCWVAPGLGFGLLMTLGSIVVFTNDISVFAVLVCLLPFLLSNNLLLINQFPDINADKSVGRQHIPIVYGKNFSSHLFGLTVLNAIGLVVYLFIHYRLSNICLSALVPLIFGLFIYTKILKYKDDIDKLIPFMGLNVVVTLLTPVLFGIGLLVG